MKEFIRWVKVIFYSITFFSLMGFASAKAYHHYGLIGMLELVGVNVPIKTETKEVEKIVEVHKRAKFEEALAKRIAKSPLPHVLVRGVLRKEGKERPKRMSYIKSEWGNESHRKFAQGRTPNSDEQRQWASSHCPFQVMAMHADKAGLEWSDLYDPEICVDLGMKVLESCWQEAQGYDTLERVDRTGRCYNGGNTKTQNVDAIAYGRSLREWAGIAALEYEIERKGSKG